MRAFVVLLALAISPVALTVCQLTCSAETALHQHLGGVPSCHESTGLPTGPTVKADSGCEHSDGDLVLTKALTTFQLSVPVPKPSNLIIVVEQQRNVLETTAVWPASPPPPLLPLRI
ncbi:MAG TPA: hypothetical protein VJN96_09295 [Vicinamibacterales bacterium]|nr:hypothetical protein [Vicinamibacterales bacterium]